MSVFDSLAAVQAQAARDFAAVGDFAVSALVYPMTLGDVVVRRDGSVRLAADDVARR